MMAMQSGRMTAVTADFQFDAHKQGSSCFAWNVLAYGRSLFSVSPGIGLAKCSTFPPSLRGGGFPTAARNRPFMTTVHMKKDSELLQICRDLAGEPYLTSSDVSNYKSIKKTFEALKITCETDDKVTVLQKIHRLLGRCRTGKCDHTLPNLVRECVEIAAKTVGKQDVKILTLAATTCSEKGFLNDALIHIEELVSMEHYPSIDLCNRLLFSCLKAQPLDKLALAQGKQHLSSNTLVHDENSSLVDLSAVQETIRAIKSKKYAWDRMVGLLELIRECGHEPNSETYFLLLL
jgi:hypothetical protein